MNKSKLLAELITFGSLQ